MLFSSLSLQLMCRKEIISKCISLATILLVACLMLFLHPRSISVSVLTPADTENQLSIQQGLDNTISFGLVHDDTQFVSAFILAVALLLSFFPAQDLIRVSSTNTTTILSRNFCCIVPKGP